MPEAPMRLHVQYIPIDPDHAALWPASSLLPPLLKGWTQPVEIGDLIEPAPGSIWRIAHRKWRCVTPTDVHLTLWVEPAAPPRDLPPLAQQPPVLLH